MDPVSIIVTALTTGAAAALKPTAEKVVKDAYEGLKSIITRRYAQKGDLSEAITRLEEKPESAGRKEVVKEEVIAAGAERDDHIVQLALTLLESIGEKREGRHLIQQTVTGNQNTFSGSGDVTVHAGRRENGA